MSDDVLARLAATIDPHRCGGASGDYVYHCAECCYGAGFTATSQEELDDLLLMRDASAAIRAERARAERAEAALEEAQLRSIEARNPGIDMDEVRRMRAAPTDTPATGRALPRDLRLRDDADAIEGRDALSFRWRPIRDRYWDDCAIVVRYRTTGTPATEPCPTCLVPEDHPLRDALDRLFGRPVTHAEAQRMCSAICPDCSPATADRQDQP